MKRGVHGPTVVVAVFAAAVGVLGVGCGAKPAARARGAEGGDCFANHTCLASLRCFSNLCVRYDGGAGPGGAAGGDAGSGVAGSGTAGSGAAGSSAASGAGAGGSSAGSSGGAGSGAAGSGAAGAGTAGAGGGGNAGTAGAPDAGTDAPHDATGNVSDASDAPVEKADAAIACQPGSGPSTCDDRTPLVCGADHKLAPRIEGPCCGNTPACSGGQCVACAGDGLHCVLGASGLVTQTCGGASVGTAASPAACGATCGSTPTTPAPKSCAAGGPGAGANCGKAATDDCCASPSVPCGVSNLPATVSDFRLDKYELTIGRFRAFVKAGRKSSAAAPMAGAGANPHTPGSGWDSAWNHFLDDAPVAGRMFWTTDPGATENMPAAVSWYEAFAFCIWDGGRLPTYAEWHYAATGGDEQRVYPWGNAPWDISLAVGGCLYDGDPSCTIADIAPVGSLPAGNARWGQSDLAGNMPEWVIDYLASAFETPCLDCAQLTCGKDQRLDVGGSQTDVMLLRNDQWTFNAPPSLLGARCARAP